MGSHLVRSGTPSRLGPDPLASAPPACCQPASSVAAARPYHHALFLLRMHASLQSRATFTSQYAPSICIMEKNQHGITCPACLGSSPIG